MAKNTNEEPKTKAPEEKAGGISHDSPQKLLLTFKLNFEQQQNGEDAKGGTII